MIYSILYKGLLDYYGWRGTYIMISALNSNILVCAALLRPRDSCNKKNSMKTYKTLPATKTFCQRQLQSFGCNLLCENKLFCLNTIGVFLGNFAYINGLLMFVPCAIDKGLPFVEAALLGTIVGICALISRCIHGAVAYLRLIDDRYIAASMLVIRGVSFMIVPLSGSFGMLAVLAVIIGISIGIYSTALYVFLEQLVGAENYAGGVGVSVFAFGAAAMMAPSTGGALFDSTGNYDALFYFNGAIAIISGTIHLIVALLLRQKEIKRPGVDEDESHEVYYL
ncbi:monocarboxylate transporter 2-like [Saccoglossus kowalevskii]